MPAFIRGTKPVFPSRGKGREGCQVGAMDSRMRVLRTRLSATATPAVTSRAVRTSEAAATAPPTSGPRPNPATKDALDSGLDLTWTAQTEHRGKRRVQDAVGEA